MFVLILGQMLLTAACATYSYKPIPLKDVGSYQNSTNVAGIQMGAQAFYDTGKLKDVFGFNMKAAGVVPVQIALENRSGKTVGVATGSMVLDEDGNWWEPLPADVVFSRINDYTSGEFSGNQLLKDTFLYGLAGAVVGAAVGVATGTSVGEAAGKGAAIGGALGASKEILSMSGDSDDSEKAYSISKDFSGRDLSYRAINPQTMEHGFLYFPAEMKAPVKLRLFITDVAKNGKDKGRSLGTDVMQVDLPL